MPKARLMPSLSTPGDGASSYLRRAWAMRSAIWSRQSAWELLKEGPPMTFSIESSPVGGRIVR